MEKNKLYQSIKPVAKKVNNDGLMKWQEELKKNQCAAQKVMKQHQDNLKEVSENFRKFQEINKK